MWRLDNIFYIQYITTYSPNVYTTPSQMKIWNRLNPFRIFFDEYILKKLLCLEILTFAQICQRYIEKLLKIRFRTFLNYLLWDTCIQHRPYPKSLKYASRLKKNMKFFFCIPMHFNRSIWYILDYLCLVLLNWRTRISIYLPHFANCKGGYQKQVQAPLFTSGLTDE